MSEFVPDIVLYGDICIKLSAHARVGHAKGPTVTKKQPRDHGVVVDVILSDTKSFGTYLPES